MPLSKAFFDYTRQALFSNHMDQTQVDTLNAIYDQGLQRKMLLNMIAYCMATPYHEVGYHLDPKTEEIGKGKSKFYGQHPGANSNKSLNTNPPYNKLFYYGRGLSQITWCDNYQRMGSRILYPLAEQPELCLQTAIGVDILLEGMQYGIFTGRKLSQYFSLTQTDFIGARHIINGTDQAEKIALYAQHFHYGLHLNEHAAAPAIPPTPKPAAPVRPVAVVRPNANPPTTPARVDGLWADIRRWWHGSI